MAMDSRVQKEARRIRSEGLRDVYGSAGTTASLAATLRTKPCVHCCDGIRAGAGGAAGRTGGQAGYALLSQEPHGGVLCAPAAMSPDILAQPIAEWRAVPSVEGGGEAVPELFMRGLHQLGRHHVADGVRGERADVT